MTLKTFSTVGSMLLMLVLVSALIGRSDGSGHCEPMTFDKCSFNGNHKFTIFPNKKGDQNMDDAMRQFDQFSALLRLDCSPYLQQFLCFYMFPACSTSDRLLNPFVAFPCRSLCELVREPCDRALRTLQSQFNWDVTDIRCDLLPEESDSPNCIKAVDTQIVDSKTPNVNLNHSLSATVSAPYRSTSCEPSVIRTHSVYVPKCGADVLFNSETKYFTNVWMVVWSSLCCIASFLTFITILRDKERFAYPERPVMFLALCYCGYSLAYLVRAAAGPQSVSCERNQKSCEVLVREDIQPLCMVVFIVGYFFSLSAAVWWLMFTIGWLLSAAVKWTSEAIESRASYFHLFAWAAPACLTTVVIVLRKVEGDELTGMCLVGVSQDKDLLLFQIVPQAVLLIAGVVLLSAGFISMSRIHDELESSEVGTDKFDKLVVKVAVSAAFYIVPNLAILGCTVYQYLKIPDWNAHVKRVGDRQERRPTSDNLPIAELFIFKIFMSFAVGISLLMWICSKKTLQGWRTCLLPRRGGHGNKRRVAESREQQASYYPLDSIPPQSPTAQINGVAIGSGNLRSQHSSSSASRGNSRPIQATNANANANDANPFLSTVPYGTHRSYPYLSSGPGTTSYLAYNADEMRLASTNSATPQQYNAQYGLSQQNTRPLFK